MNPSNEKQSKTIHVLCHYFQLHEPFIWSLSTSQASSLREVIKNPARSKNGNITTSSAATAKYNMKINDYMPQKRSSLSFNCNDWLNPLAMILSSTVQWRVTVHFLSVLILK